MKIRLLAFSTLFLSIGSTGLIQESWATKLPSRQSSQKPLDASSYDAWKSIRGTTLSRDGKWLIAPIVPQEGDSNVMIKNLDDGRIINLPRGTGVRFSKDSNFAIGTVVPPFADTKAARRKKTKPEDMPKNALAIIDLKSGRITQVEGVTSFLLPDEDAGWMSYRLEPPKEEPPKDATKTTPKETPKKEKKPGQPMVIRNLVTRKEETVPFVTQVVFAKKGESLLYATATKDGKGDGVTLLNLDKDSKTALSTATGDYPQLTLNQTGELAGYEYKPEAPEPKTPKGKEADTMPSIPAELYFYRAGSKAPERIGQDSLSKGWSINENSAIRFSETGTRLIYATYPTPPPPPKEVPDDEKVSLDVWTWQDTKLMPSQILDAETEKKRGYTAIYEVASKKSVQLADRDLPNIQISDKGDGRFALASTDVPYERESSWDPGFEDVVVIDLKDTQRYFIARHHSGSVEMSPKGEYVALFDDVAQTWTAYNCSSHAKKVLTPGIKFPLYDELTDVPSPAPAYGLQGWASESHPLIADRFDLWECDATGKDAPTKLTSGRDLSIVFRPIKLDADEIYLNADNMLLSAFNSETKQSGVYNFHGGYAKRLIMDNKMFEGIVKAKDSDRLVYTRQDFVEFPNLWATNLAFENPVQETDANPQQKDYLWGKAELVRWTSLDGVPLSGVLIKPANFDYGKQYPMITYFYERNSDTLNDYHIPSPSASTVNMSYLASNGYVVFIPDIPYRIGYPGYSALSAIVPGVQSIVSRGYVDPKRLGIQGQSWGGYQVAYLVTQTNMFAAAEAGAPVADMFSAYGGIRYGSGVVREMQYEHGQSRIGGTPWDSPLKYIENSPLFFADKVATPIMIMSNDKDGAVPHTQGIEFFTALRRLDKPCWMVVYNGEDHNIMERKNRKDFGIRLYQFFDHFLKGAPAPEWMAKGISAVDKGRNMGLDLTK